jgi:hypothetical protein
VSRPGVRITTPPLKVPAEVVAKRSRTYGGSNNTSTSTSYYATFQVESGDRMELAVKGSEFDMLAEGDLGILAFQGTRSHGLVSKSFSK